MIQDNFITELLDMEDSHILVDCIEKDSDKMVKYVHIHTDPMPQFCEKCGHRMYSKGLEQRHLTHPVLQDGYRLVIIYSQRRLKCSNPECGHHCNESVSFISKWRRSTDVADMLVIDAFRDIRLTTSQIAERFHISDTAARYTFSRYVDMKRLPLTEAICIDEVHIDSPGCEYGVLIQDFCSGEPIDFKESRKEKVMMPYLSSIPRKERLRVKYLVSDMFNSYISYVDKYFPNAVSVVDSFHVVQMINKHIKDYMIQRAKEFKRRDSDRERQLQEERHNPRFHLRMSDEVYLYDRCRWVILKNQDSLEYGVLPDRPDRHFRYYMDIYAYEEKFMNLDPQLMHMRELKEKYIRFNTQNAGNREKAARELPLLIDEYMKSGIDEFIAIAGSLKKHREAILNSFIMYERTGSRGPYASRLSNGPMEGLNRKPKDMKRDSRGYLDFEYLRNRLLFATRKNAPILAVPRTISQVRKDTYTGKKRGKYRKK